MIEDRALAIHSEESEQAVIGAILVDENCFDIVRD
jgi:replicative DNA helicase